MRKFITIASLSLVFVLILTDANLGNAQDQSWNDESMDCNTGMVCFDWEHAVWHPVGEGGYWTDPKNFGQVVNDPDVCDPTGDWCMINYPGYSFSGGTGGGDPFQAVNFPIPLEIIPPPCSNPPCFVPPTPQPTVVPPIGKCPGPHVIPGQITASALKIAPPYPLVVGQDPSKRGVDLTFSFSIQPTQYHTWTWEIVDEIYVCRYDSNGGHTGCPKDQYDNGWRSWWESNSYRYVEHDAIWGCAEHVKLYREGVLAIFPSANLSKSSINWIMRDLAQRYPGAFLHHPNWTWGSASPGLGGFSGSTFVWNFHIEKVQVSDPGIYALVVSGTTTGTPVSISRSFSINAGSFDDYLLETAIIH